MSDNYDDLAAQAERGDLAAKPGTVRRGAAASEEARRMLMEATGAATLSDAMTLAMGRPPVGAEKNGASPVVRSRVPAALKAQVVAQAAREHRNESDIVRDALVAYLTPKSVKVTARGAAKRQRA